MPIVPRGGVILVPPSKKQISPSKRWTITLNNYSEQDILVLSAIVPHLCEKYIISKEVGKCGTPHLQGYIKFFKKVRPVGALGVTGAHYEKAVGSDLENYVYCTKDVKTDSDIVLSAGMPKPVRRMTWDLLRPWQQVIADLFKEREDPLFGRKIYWYWEKTGNIGKSILCKYMIDNMNAFVVSGSGTDIKHGLVQWIEKNGEAPPIIVIDIPRSANGHVAFGAIESIKNGFFFSGKYESTMVRFNIPHILCFANHEPGATGEWGESDEDIEDNRKKLMSEDRWVTTKLDIVQE